MGAGGSAAHRRSPTPAKRLIKDPPTSIAIKRGVYCVMTNEGPYLAMRPRPEEADRYESAPLPLRRRENFRIPPPYDPYGDPNLRYQFRRRVLPPSF